MKLTLLVISLALSIGCSTTPKFIERSEDYSNDGKNEIYVVGHGWHTGFVIPAEQVKEEIPELLNRFGNVAHIEFGWGDKGFYQAKEITTGLTLKAIFWPTEAVIHAVAVPIAVDAYFYNSEVEKLILSDSELSSLLQFIVSSFDKDEQDNVIPLKNGIYGDSQFYQGSGKYYLMNTCNKWTAKGLKSIGMDINPLFKLTASSIMDYLKERRSALKVSRQKNF